MIVLKHLISISDFLLPNLKLSVLKGNNKREDDKCSQ